MEEVKDEVAEAQALLQKKEQEKVEAFRNEYQSICQKYGYGMSAYVTISQAGVVPSLEIVKLQQ